MLVLDILRLNLDLEHLDLYLNIVQALDLHHEGKHLTL
jgi:hypothetical protein